MRISDWSSDVCSSDLWWRRCPVVPRQACVPPQDRLASARRALRRAVTRRVVAAHRGRSAARTSRGGASRKQLIAQTFRHRCSRESGSPESLRTALVVLGSRFRGHRSDEHTPELQSLTRISYAVFCLKPNKLIHTQLHTITPHYTH